MASDTIFALSSGAPPCGVSVIRISGSATTEVLQAVAGRCPEPRRAELRAFVDADGLEIDRGLALFFPGPASVTGEDVAEFHVHGSEAVVSALLRRLSAFDGCRMARAGEFTLRALLNGKMDLADVEALGDLLQARTEMQRRLAITGSSGQWRARFLAWQEAITAARVRLEADLDFSDEADIAAQDGFDIGQALRPVIGEMQAATGSAARAELVRRGLRVAIVGLPNAGKSSLLNTLAQREAAIVTEEAGTTRDVIEVEMDIGGHRVVLCDTAGIREAESAAERIGVDRAHRTAESADLVLSLRDLSDPQAHHVALSRDAVLVGSKADEATAEMAAGEIAVSSLTGTGMDALLAKLGSEAARRIEDPETVTILNARHKAETERAVRALWSAAEADAPAEIVAEHLRAASHALDRVTGIVDAERLLDDIFSTYCIGK